ncbi:MAG: glycosyltransferase [Cyclobacteriaceae bacterium]|nr:glycosyltransferase [Cyclobacteriaceae bacterium]
MLNVLHIIKSLGRGGAETLLPETMALHNQQKFRLHVIYFLPWKDQMVGAIKAAGGEPVCMNKTNNWQILNSVNEVADYCRQQDIHLIHAHLPWAGFLARRVGGKTGLPVVYTEHNKQERYHFLTKWINKATFNNQDMAIAVSDDVAVSINKNIRPKIPVKTVLNGVNTKKFKREDFVEKGKETRAQCGISDDAIVIGTVAVFRTQKRLDLWADMACKLAKDFPDLHFIMLGDGPMEDAIREKIKEHHLEARFHLPGRLEEVRPWLAAMDIYLMTSEFEGLPIALLEAMSMELPVATTTAGGIAEVITDGREGFLAPVENPDELIGPLKKLIEDPKLRKKMGAAAYKRIIEKFSMERMVDELEDIYRSF